jgi:hypothetical protein
VAPQALFTMNAPFVIDQMVALTERPDFKACSSDEDRIRMLYERILLRAPAAAEISRIIRFLEQQRPLFEKPPKITTVLNPWPLVAQSMVMSNEFLYVD